MTKAELSRHLDDEAARYRRRLLDLLENRSQAEALIKAIDPGIAEVRAAIAVVDQMRKQVGELTDLGDE